jgi:uncharacterized protein (TIGR02118 family)
VIKMLAPALRHPENRSLAAFHRYWAESHGPLFSNTRRLCRYVQHLALPETYGDPDLAPTYDGCSMFWFDDLDTLRHPGTEPFDRQLWDLVMADDRQLFDRSDAWPSHERFAMVIAEEHPVVDGPANPGMVKAIWTVARRPGLTTDRFLRRWSGSHAEATAELPGLRRYVQNHVLVEAHTIRGLSHDGWSELWFDDLDALRAAVRSATGDEVRGSGSDLFASPSGLCVAVERVQKELGGTPRRWTTGMTSGDVVALLSEQGYHEVASQPAAGDRLRRADDEGRLLVWTDEHLVAIDDPVIDARPL